MKTKLHFLVSMQIRNIGIVAHVDAGKTTLTEQLMYVSGAIDAAGSVDKGSTVTDSLDLEKRRGITIQSSSVSFQWGANQINLIDTPGHIDFAGEVDRAMTILDGVVLVVSAVEGVQAHTLNLWESLQDLGIPVFIFINKIDRLGVDLEDAFSSLEKDLNVKGFCMNHPVGGGLENSLKRAADAALIEKSIENLVELDEELLEAYLQGDLLSRSDLPQKRDAFILQKSLVPIYFGIAKDGLGVAELAEDLMKFPSRNTIETHDANAQIFKIEHHKKFGKLAHIRLYSGLLQSKNSLYCKRLNKEVKIHQLLQNKKGRLEVIQSLVANDVGIVAIADDVISGDVLGKELVPTNSNKIAQSVLTVQIEAVEEKDYHNLAKALQILDSEDPGLDFVWYKAEREFQLKIMGEMQSEVLSHTLKERFDLEVSIQAPQIIYKETPSKEGEGFVRYWMPKPCWAIMTFKVEAGELNSGIQYESLVGVNDISQKYQNEIKRALPKALQQGIKGWPVSDIKITLLSGEEHSVHSNPGDFLLATPMGIMRAIENAGTDLLEPFYDFEIKANQELLGAIAGDLNQMNAAINTPIFSGDNFILKGSVAVAKAIDYGIQFIATTSGKGRLKLTVGSYRKTEFSEEKRKKYKGVNPLDEAQWILHNRGAYKADERS